MTKLLPRRNLRRNSTAHFGKASTKTTSRVDNYLQRFSALAQIGLAIFTIGTIYTTVIPLYQKSLLEESIAKKEVELKKLTLMLETAYQKVRKNVVQNYISIAGPECSGLLSENFEFINDSKNSRTRKSYGDFIFELDVSNCVFEVTKTTKTLNELRAEDRDTFNKHISRIQKELTILKKEDQIKYNKVLETPIDKLPPIDPSSFSNRTMQTISALMSPESIKKYQKKIIVDQERLRIASNYLNTVREKILSLRNIDWTTSNTLDRTR